MADIHTVKSEREAELLAIPGVVGVGIVDGPLGQPAIGIYVANTGVQSTLPKNIDGFDVVVHVSGEFDAQSSA